MCDIYKYEWHMPDIEFCVHVLEDLASFKCTVLNCKAASKKKKKSPARQCIKAFALVTLLPASYGVTAAYEGHLVTCMPAGLETTG